MVRAADDGRTGGPPSCKLDHDTAQQRKKELRHLDPCSKKYGVKVSLMLQVTKCGLPYVQSHREYWGIPRYPVQSTVQPRAIVIAWNRNPSTPVGDGGDFTRRLTEFARAPSASPVKAVARI
jgi:hypothetical protein